MRLLMRNRDVNRMMSPKAVFRPPCSPIHPLYKRQDPPKRVESVWETTPNERVILGSWLPGRVALDDSAGRDVSGDHRASPDYGLLADPDSREDEGGGADLAGPAQASRRMGGGGGVHRSGQHLHAGGQEGVLPHDHPRSDDAIGLHTGSLAHSRLSVQHARVADHGTFLDDRSLPYSRMVSNHGARADPGSGVDERVRTDDRLSLDHRRGRLGPRAARAAVELRDPA